jgi:kinesin family protein 5
MKKHTFDSITTMASNIKVIARFRPSSAQQPADVVSKGTIVEFPSSTSCTLLDKGLTFTFDRVFAPTTTQEELFETSLCSTVKDLMQGYNGTVLAYGQTGSGKTHTMFGQPESEQQRGAIPRIVDMIFAAIATGSEEIEYTVKVSYMEIYMEKIRDLLQLPAPGQTQTPAAAKSLPIHEDRTRGVYVKGLTEEYVSSRAEIEVLMQKGSRARAVGKTRMNAESSRSHAIFTISVGQKNMATNNVRTGKLSLVDLAGSEKVNKTGVVGQSLEEAKKINQSLSALGMVINALAGRAAAAQGGPSAAASSTAGQSHVPYRDSKLTRILQESLGGNSRTTLIINCSSDAYNATETLSTLRFGERAKGIQNKAKINTELSAIELRQIVHDLKRELKKSDTYARQLEAELAQWRAGEPVNKRDWVDLKTNAARSLAPAPLSPGATGELLTPPATPRANSAAAFRRGHSHSLSLQPNPITSPDQVAKKRASSKRNSFQPGAGVAAAAAGISRQPSPIDTASTSTDTEETDVEDRLQELLGRENALQDQLAEQETMMAAQAVQIKELTAVVAATTASTIFGPDPQTPPLSSKALLEAESRLAELQTEFDEMKSALMSDIQDRCQRVVELEIELDLLQDKNRSLARANNNIGLGGGSTNGSSSSAATAAQQQQQSQDKIRALQKDLDMATKILDLKNDRIMELELQVQARGPYQQQQKQQQKYGSPVYTRDGQAFLYNDIPPAPAPVAHVPKIVKPLRGGGGIDAYPGPSTLAHGRGAHQHTRNNSIWNKINAIVNPSY